MARSLVLTGKSGPAFGDRASAVHVATLATGTRVTNWPASERVDALRACFDSLDGEALGGE